jgi:AraC-like DNA-binding protein
MYRAMAPSPELATWVSSSWRETVTVASHVDGVHPDASIDIVWDGTALAVFGPRARSEAPRDLRAGAVVGVRLRPGSTRAMLGEAAIALADRTVPLETLWGSAARAAAERIHRSGPDGAVAALSSVISERGRSSIRGPDPLIPRVVDLAGLQRTVRDIANEVDLSQRQLFRRCVDEIGYGPKHLVRVLRLQRLLGLARRLPEASLAGLAAAAGYADESHMSRDCRALTGVTPARLLRSQRHLPR